MPFGLEALALVPMGWGIDWMVMVGETTAAWSEAWGGVPAAPAGALLLVVAGFLWLALWKERWRLLGIAAMVAAIPVALAAARPDILVHQGGQTVAVRAEDGRYVIVNPKAERFATEYWLRADGDSRAVDDGLAAGVRCDGAGCVATLTSGLRLAVGAASTALEDDCRLADIVVSRSRAPSWCHGRAIVIDRAALSAGGAHALYARQDEAGGGPMFQIRTAYPSGPRRPFMPPAQ
jgi:competence protein ComEC